MFEFYQSHSGVIMQPGFDSKYYSGLNPYSVGFAMFQDIKRVSVEPTDEDREWFAGQDWVGRGDWHETLDWAMRNFKDESFIQQFLTPTVIRDLKLFNILDDETDPKLEVTAIHEKIGYKEIRESMAKQYNLGHRVPDLAVFDVDLWGDRSITIHHNMVDDRPLEKRNTTEVLKHLQRLWGYDVRLESVDSNRKTRVAFELCGDESFLDVFLANE